MQRECKLSIVMPVYNAEKYLSKCLQSLLNQTFKNFEVILVNDGSKDRSLDVLKKYEKSDGRFHVINLPLNLGYSKAINNAVAASKGNYIAFMDADDICLPERFLKQVEFLDQNLEYGLVGTQYYRMRPDDSIIRKTYSAADNFLMRFRLFFSVPTCNPTVMFRREILDEIGQPFFNLDMIGAPEYDFFLRIPDKWKMAVLPDYLFQYRIHSEALGTTKKDKVMEETLGLCQRYIAQRLPDLAENEDVFSFIRTQRDNREPLTATKLRTFQRGLKVLVLAYVNGAFPQERSAVKAFACELEIKTLLGRYKVWRQPKLLLAWLFSPCNGALCWMPQLVRTLVKEKLV